MMGGGQEELEVVGWWQSKIKGASRVVQSVVGSASVTCEANMRQRGVRHQTGSRH